MSRCVLRQILVGAPFSAAPTHFEFYKTIAMSKFASVLLCLSSTATAALGVATSTSTSPNSPNEQPQLRGGVAASVESGRGVSCYNEVVFTITCDDGTRATYDAVNDGGCNDAWASGRARQFINEYW